jgi:cytochrome c-type biogenesis protein CcmH
MPLAILKRKASELPITFTLDDSTAMADELKLSRFELVIVGARVSKTGNAIPQSGDLIGQSSPVKAGGKKLTLTIDGVQP